MGVLLTPVRMYPCRWMPAEDRPTPTRPGQVPFQAHIDLLHLFLARRAAIVEGIQGLLNAQRKPSEYLQNGSRLSHLFEDVFFTLTARAPEQSRLRGQLEEAHWSRGFTPRPLAGLHNGLADPAEMMVRAFHLWQQTRWPGRTGRIGYAHTLFHLYVIRCLTLLSMRVWDDESRAASDRLSQVQRVLDQLWATAAPRQPVLVRDARWLIPLAQSPATDDLGAYFDIAQKVADRLSEEDRLEVHRAGVLMAAGHLRSQIRYHAMKDGVSFDDRSLVVRTRGSNALDHALLIQDLVPLLQAYENAVNRQDAPVRYALAAAILQGVSPDPELFLDRVDLLGAYSMIEHIFITTTPDGAATYTPLGQRHVQLVRQYAERIGRVAKSLADDAPRFRPTAGTYSPYGVLYGFSSDLLEHMTLKATQPDAVTTWGLEDVFVDGDADRLAWVNGWRTLPHLARAVQQLFEYPHQFAENVFGRVEQALRQRGSHGKSMASRGRLFVMPHGDPHSDSKTPAAPALPDRYIEPSRAGERREGRYLVSYETPGGTLAISKALLTEVLGEGRDATVAGLPALAAAVLKMMCLDAVQEEDARPGRPGAGSALSGRLDAMRE